MVIRDNSWLIVISQLNHFEAKMRAWVLEKQAPIEERPLELKEVHTPNPGPPEVRIKNVACGVCRTDIHVAEGDLPLKKSPLV